MLQLNTLSVALFNQIVSVGLTLVEYAANFLDCYSYYYPVFHPKNCDSNFLLRRLNHGVRKQLSMAAEGTGQKVLAHNKFKNMVVDVPKFNEQKKIGLLFERLDHLITLHLA